MSHTPLPWRCDDRGIIRSEDGTVIAQVSALGDTRSKVEEAVSNGLLLAAAPKLLAACEEFVRKVECGEARSLRSYAQMQAAIAEAKEGWE